MRSLPWIAVLVALALVEARPSKKNEQKLEPVDESDRTLIRVARADLDEDDEPKVTSYSSHHKKRPKEAIVKRKKRATEEDEFFQALLSRKEDNKKEKKRSYEEGAEDKAYIKRDDWKGDSKISDADRQELENLFSEITSPEEEKEKVEETRSLKPGIDGKVQNFIEWLMSQPPDKFTKSLSHILDTEASLTKTFYDGNTQASAQDQDASSNSTNSTLGKNCKKQCYTFQFGDGLKCEIMCSPPVIEKPTGAPYPSYMQQTPNVQYPVQAQMPCTTPNCQGVGAQGLSQDAYPAPSQYGAQMPAMIPQWPMQNGCTGALCDTGRRKSDQDANEGKGDDKNDDTSDSASVVQQSVAPQVPGVNQGQVIAPQVSPVQVMVDPSSFSTMVPAVPVAPIMQAPVAPVAPVAPAPVQPYTNGYAPAPVYQASDETQQFKPMPKDCEDYSSPECQVFLDWPTDEHNEVKASLRFRQNWDDDYNDKKSRRFNVLKTEIEKGITNAYIKNPNFEKVEVNSLSKEDVKVSANFVMRFKQAEYGVLRYLSRAISSNYLQSMPVYRDTLLRDGLKHHHRSIVAKQEDLDKVPSRVQDPEPDVHEPLNTKSRAYQGCFRDRKPHRDLEEKFSKYDMTPEWCVGRCKLAGYKFAGLQYAYLCFCGNSFGKYGRALNDQCDSRCFGDSSRNCGSFWHNSVFSVDGYAYNPMKEQHANINGEYEGDDDETDDNDEQESKQIDSSSDVASASGSGEVNHAAAPAAKVANKLMKAAASALKAAKKLLPPGKKSKRSNDEELEKHKGDAIAALAAAQNLMGSSPNVVRREAERRKREAELQHGKDLLVAYLSDVGGYDRQYRDVEDEDENESVEKGTKFEYRRMVIDESGDGEFVERQIDRKKIQRARRRRNIAAQNLQRFNGPMKMASRAVEETTDLTKRSFFPAVPEVQPAMYVGAEHKPSDDGDSADEATESGNGDEPEDSGESFEEDENEESGETEQSNEDASSGEPEFGLESGESGNAEESGDEYGFSREERSVALSRRRRDVEKEEERDDVKETRKTRKRDVSLNDDKVASITESAQKGVEGLIPIVVDIFKQEKRMREVEDFVAQLKKNIIKQVSVSQDKEQALMDRTSTIIKAAAVAKLNELSKSLRDDMQDYKTNHPAVSQQAKEAIDAILDLPVFQDAVENLKSRIKKRAVELEVEYKKVKEGSETLPPILKEHFKRNAPEDKKRENLSRGHRDVKH